MSDTQNAEKSLAWQPCPFCGDRDIRFIRTERDHPNDQGDEWVVECGSCPAELRWFDSLERALERWNTRPAPPPVVTRFDYKRANELGDAIVQRICDSPDHTSPDDDQQLLCMYPSELHTAVVAELENEFERLTGRSCLEQPAVETPAILPDDRGLPAPTRYPPMPSVWPTAEETVADALDFVLRERINLQDGAFYQRADANRINPDYGWYSFPSIPDGISAALCRSRDRILHEATNLNCPIHGTSAGDGENG